MWMPELQRRGNTLEGTDAIQSVLDEVEKSIGATKLISTTTTTTTKEILAPGAELFCASI